MNIHEIWLKGTACTRDELSKFWKWSVRVRSCVSAPAGRVSEWVSRFLTCCPPVTRLCLFQGGMTEVFTLLNTLVKHFKLRWKSGRLSYRVGQIVNFNLWLKTFRVWRNTWSWDIVLKGGAFVLWDYFLHFNLTFCSRCKQQNNGYLPQA